MPSVDESTLRVQLELQGRSLTSEVKSWSIESDYLTSTDGFSFTCYAQDFAQVRGLEMQPVELKVNDSSQLLGRIEKSTIGTDGSAVTYEGRDYLADLVECSVDPAAKIKEGMDLFAAITAIAGPVGIDTVLSDGDLALRNIRTGKSIAGGAGKEFQKLKAEEIDPDYGDTIFGFLAPIVARHGATIQPANSRNAVLLTSPNYTQPASYKVQRKLGDAAGNNVIRGTASRDFSRFPTYTLFNGSQTRPAQPITPTSAPIAIGVQTGFVLAAAPFGFPANIFRRPNKPKRPTSTTKTYSTADAAAGFAPSAEDIILDACHIGRRKPQDGTGDPLKMYRLLAVRDDKSRTQEQLERVAVRRFSERIKEILVYDVEVQGHVDPNTGAIWSVDTIVDVVDEVCDIAEPLWIAQRTLKFDDSAGATTSLTCWRPGTFLT